MSKTTVYDLGEVHVSPTPARPTVAVPAAAGAAGAVAAVPQAVAAKRASVSPAVSPPATSRGFDVSGTLALVVPGAGHLVRKDFTTGFFFLVSMGFLASFGWALLQTLDRLSETLVVLGHPRAVAVWFLGAIYVIAALLHVGSVLTSGSREERAPHPVVAGLASLVVPGWGQILNGDRKRAALFLAGLWLIGASWLLVSPQCLHLLASLKLHLPTALLLVSSAPVRWTLPAVVLALAVYDAASSAAGRR